MPVKSDQWIIDQSEKHQMISPFSRDQVKKVELPNSEFKNVISFGVSSYGYDMRIGTSFQLLKNTAGLVLDPKNIQPDQFEKIETPEPITLPPQRLLLAQTMEYFKIPREILTICFGKSTYARCGVFVNVTPFEPEWEGFATIGITNMGSSPVKVYPQEGIAQLIFLQADEVCQISYRDKKGKYQAQKEITTARV